MAAETPNIWLFNHYASDMFREKAGRHYWFAKKLAERGYTPTVFCASTYLSNGGSEDMQGKKWAVKYDGDTPFVFIKTPEYTGNGLGRVINMSSFYFGLFPAARAYAKQNGKPDIILASSVHPLTMAAGIKLAKKFHVPCICEVRDLWPEAIFAIGILREGSLLGRLLTAGEHRIYRRADALIFTKEGDTDYLKEKGWTTAQGGDIDLGKCHYISNGVDLATFTAQAETERLDDPDLTDGGINIVYTGVLRSVNDVGSLLDCAKLLAGYPDIRFFIYGDGCQLDHLRGRVQVEGIRNVRLKGFIARKYIPYVLSKSSVNILNYSQKKFNWTRGNSSNKLFEYMASGKPVISTVKTGYSIINRYNCGIELDECTPQALAAAILSLRNLPEARRAELGRNARAGAEDYDFIPLTDRLTAVIDSII